MRARTIAVAILLGFVSRVPDVSADHTIWLHPKLVETEGSLYVTSPPGNPLIWVKTTTPGPDQWVQFPVVIPSNVEVKSVQLCYQLSNASSFISHIRITQMTTPPSHTVYLDDPTPRTSTASTCITSAATSFVPQGTVTISVRFNFANTTDVITIGVIGLNVAPATVSTPMGTNEPSPSIPQNYPNPFKPSTTIQYSVERAAQVKLDIYNVAGQLVRSLVDERAVPGTHRVTWDSRDDGGHATAPGVYFYQVSVAGKPSGARQMIVLQ